MIEILVSLSIFAVVATVGVGSLMVLINANSKVQNMQSAVSNASFALDSMTRQIRTGAYYDCVTGSPTSNDMTNQTYTNDCSSPYSTFFFTETATNGITANLSNHRVGYRVASLSNGNKAIERWIDNGASWQPITASNVNIDTFQFIVSHSSNSNDRSPTVSIYLHGSVGGASAQDTNGSFALQTSITQLVPDI